MKPSIADLTAFVAVGRHQSFRAAADALGVSRSSLSHALRALKATLASACSIGRPAASP